MSEEENKTTPFSKWWEINKAIYNKAGITKNMAYSIWYAAAEACINVIKEERNNLIK